MTWKSHGYFKLERATGEKGPWGPYKRKGHGAERATGLKGPRGWKGHRDGRATGAKGPRGILGKKTKPMWQRREPKYGGDG